MKRRWEITGENIRQIHKNRKRKEGNDKTQENLISEAKIGFSTYLRIKTPKIKVEIKEKEEDNK